MSHKFNSVYENEHTEQIGFPVGGIGAGMVCIAGNGMLTSVSIDNRPRIYHEPNIFAAISVNGVSRVVEGQIPWYKINGNSLGYGNGLAGKNFGFPRFAENKFNARFPFAEVDLNDSDIPFDVKITAWNPFIPNNADDSSLPIAALEYTFTNTSGAEAEGVFSYHATREVFIHQLHGERQAYKKLANGFVMNTLAPIPEEGKEPKRFVPRSFSVTTDAEGATSNLRWLRSGWWDPQTALWRDIESCKLIDTEAYPEGEDHGMGCSIYAPIKLAAGESKTIKIILSWYMPSSFERIGEVDESSCCDGGDCCCGDNYYTPWYSGAFADVEEVTRYFTKNYNFLKKQSQTFCDTFYDNTLPDFITEAIAANLCIIKSPTVLRQKDGRMWAWEGCCDSVGCCHGSCTHVWNYAFSIPYLFSSLERTLRETEYFVSQNKEGHQNFRTNLPITPTTHTFHAASDGQLGGIMKAYREWKISGDNAWLRRMFPKMRESIDYCSSVWDPDGIGVLIEPHHNTYDIEFWGPDVMCSSFYLGALKAMVEICDFLGEDSAKYADLYAKGKEYCETKLYNGEFFIQHVMLEGLHASPELALNVPAEVADVVRKEGPRYQYGVGCISDGVIGCWMAKMCGLGDILDPEKVTSHLKSIHKYNFKTNLIKHSNPQRPAYAMRDDGGLLLCSWPNGDMPVLPFVYSNEVWTGIEYQVAAHMAAMGLVDECYDIVAALRKRYDGQRRNPFNEIECGHWYARAMASYALLGGLTGIRFDAVTKTLYFNPSIEGDFRSFFCTESGYGTAGIKDGKPFIEVVEGKIDYDKIVIG